MFRVFSPIMQTRRVRLLAVDRILLRPFPSACVEPAEERLDTQATRVRVC